MRTSHQQSLGRKGEALAADFLTSKGFTILGRNYRTPYGEIDLVTESGGVTVFVEVKTRRSKWLGPPEISITNRKQEHMRNAAEYYVQQQPERLTDWRIDVVTVQVQPGDAPPTIDHFENALT